MTSRIAVDRATYSASVVDICFFGAAAAARFGAMSIVRTIYLKILPAQMVQMASVLVASKLGVDMQRNVLNNLVT